MSAASANGMVEQAALGWLDRLALDAGVTAPAFRLAYVLAGYFRRGVETFPTMNELAAKIGMSSRSVRKLTRELESTRLLDVTTRFGRGRSNYYAIRSHEVTKSSLVIEATPPRTMAREDRRIVFAKLEEVYLDERSGYANGWSDQRVAKDLSVPVAWVAVIRDENFGSEGANDEIRSLVNEGRAMVDSILASREELAAIQDRAAKLLSEIEDKVPQIERFDRELKRVAKAAGLA